MKDTIQVTLNIKDFIVWLQKQPQDKTIEIIATFPKVIP
jgi:hypothetical protein